MNGTVQKLLKYTTNVKNCRYFSVTNNLFTQNDIKSDFTPVYKFPFIRTCALVNKLKLYQTALTGIAVPGTLILNQLNFIQFEGVMVTAALGGSGCMALYSLGYFFNKFVGFIYIDREKNIAKIAYVDFWGRRQNIEIPINDIIPLTELPITPLNGLFLTLRQFSNDKSKYKLNLRFGMILDKELFKRIC